MYTLKISGLLNNTQKIQAITDWVRLILQDIKESDIPQDIYWEDDEGNKLSCEIKEWKPKQP